MDYYTGFAIVRPRHLDGSEWDWEFIGIFIELFTPNPTQHQLRYHRRIPDTTLHSVYDGTAVQDPGIVTMGMLIETAQSFRAMNTDAEAVVCFPAGQEENARQALKRVTNLFTEAERTLSRFNPDSELRRMNARSGEPFTASPLLFDVVAASIAAARATDGIFDPTVLNDLLAAGYDRSFEELAGTGNDSRVLPARSRFSWHDIILDHAHKTISIPEGCGLDLGGIGKGWAVDRACRELQDFPGYAVDAGGDIRVGGTRADGHPWTVGLANPFLPDYDTLVLELSQGAVATSTTVKRQWQAAGNRQHHLIDPRTGKPSASGVISATVTAKTVVRAETFSKTALILGADAGIAFIENQAGVQGMLVMSDARCVSSTGFKEVQHVA